MTTLQGKGEGTINKSKVALALANLMLCSDVGQVTQTSRHLQLGCRGDAGVTRRGWPPGRTVHSAVCRTVLCAAADPRPANTHAPRPHDIDEAMHRRITMAFEFRRPDHLQRLEIWKKQLPSACKLEVGGLRVDVGVDVWVNLCVAWAHWGTQARRRASPGAAASMQAGGGCMWVLVGRGCEHMG